MDLLTMEIKVLSIGILRNNTERASYLAKKWEFEWPVLVCIRHTDWLIWVRKSYV
jgi:hypothetical protein